MALAPMMRPLSSLSRPSVTTTESSGDFPLSINPFVLTPFLFSEVSTSSGWSFSSQGENDDSVRGPGASLGLETADEKSRRLSKLPPAEVSIRRDVEVYLEWPVQVNDPKATKVDKFVMIPHPGK